MANDKRNYKNMKERLSDLKVQLLIDHPFFGVFLSHTDIREDKTIPTAATDGMRIYYNHDFFNELTNQEVKGVLLHEVLHMVYSHCDKKRKAGRSHNKWNKASDYVVNHEISKLDPNKITLPNGREINGRMFNIFLNPIYGDKLVEQVYNELDNDDSDEDGLDIHIDSTLNEDARRELEDRIISSYEMAKSHPGKLPKGVVRSVNELRGSKVPWTRVLHKYIGATLARDDYSFSTFNRRFLQQGLYLPGLKAPKLGRIGVFPDMSGSIGPEERDAFAAELSKLSGLISEIVVGCWDTKIHTWETIREMSGLRKAIDFKGDGGTSIGCVFDEITHRKEQFELIIVLTDGFYGSLPPKRQVKCPVIFVMTTDRKAEWGLTINMKV